MPETKPIIATDRIFINGALAFAAGDPVPRETADKLGIGGKRKAEGPISATADETGVIRSSVETDAASPGEPAP